MAALTLTVSATATQATFKLTYDRPASKWTEALPLGNGRIGAMVFGGTADERLQINESTLWGGVPHDDTNAEAYSQVEEIRRQIFAGKIEEAEKLSETVKRRIVENSSLTPRSLKQGGGKVDIVWNGGRLTELRVRSARAVMYRIRYGDRRVNREPRRDKPITLDGNLHTITD
jgi:hypothetical protein